ncbi:hypothetical protein ACOSP7_001386 [Xanthoceras sorbifolium]
MVASHRKSLLFTVALIIFITFLASHDQQLVAAMRPLEGEQWMKKEDSGRLAVQSLQRGPVPPSGPNPCTHIPGQGSGICSLNGQNFAGRVAPAPPAFPGLVMDFGVASVADV